MRTVSSGLRLWAGLRGLASLLVGALFGLAAVAAEPPKLTEDQLALTDIRGVPGKAGLYVIPGFDGGLSGGNIAVRVTESEVIIVDNKYAYSHDDIVEKVAKVTNLPITTVLNTHHHFDHAGANADFIPYADVISHENARTNMLANRGPSANPAGAAPTTYTDSLTLHIDEAEVRVHHFGAGHTDGDSVIFFPDLKTIHTGDLFIWGRRLDNSKLAPFVDYANGGSAKAWIGTLDAILALDFDTVIPGHGVILTRSELEIFRHRFETMLARIAQAVTNGVPREDVEKTVDLSDLDWPLPVGRVTAIYDELVGS